MSFVLLLLSQNIVIFSGSPAGGFTFGGSAAPGQNVPFTSTPMPGPTGAVQPAGGFTFGLSGNTASALIAKGRRRRAKK